MKESVKQKNNWIITTEFLDNIKNKTHGILGIETKRTNIINSCEKSWVGKGGDGKHNYFPKSEKQGIGQPSNACTHNCIRGFIII